MDAIAVAVGQCTNLRSSYSNGGDDFDYSHSNDEREREVEELMSTKLHHLNHFRADRAAESAADG